MPTAPSSLQRTTTLKRNPLFGNVFESAMFGKVPRHIGTNPRNVVFGIGSATAGAPAAFSLSANTTREMILRKAQLAVGTVRGRVSSITASGEALLQGSTVPVEMFSPVSIDKPELDLPMPSGVPVTIAGTLDAAFTIDGGITID